MMLLFFFQQLSSGNPAYEKYYRQVDPNHSGRVGAADAALFLKCSNLSDVVLGKAGHEVSLSSLSHVVPPPDFVSVFLTTALDIDYEKRKFDEIFNSLGPLSGLLTGEQVRPVLLNSNLPLDLLGRVCCIFQKQLKLLQSQSNLESAMHLVYRLLEKEPLPTSLPHRLVPPSKRAKTPGLVGAVSVLPSSPPAHRSSLRSTPSHGSLTSLGSGSSLSPKGSTAVAAPWVVPASEKAAYDEIFAKADTDHDGFVSGMESRNIFLLSGLPQQILAHVWSLADTRQQGMLNSEQFALAMYLIQQKVTLGIDPPVSLTPEMIPPSERTQQSICLFVLTKQELQLAVDRAGAGLQDVSSQQQQWRQRLADLEQQRAKLHAMLTHAQSQAREEQAISSLQLQIANQESALRGQEEELVQEKAELVHLAKEEADLEQRLEVGRRELAALAGTLQKTQGDIHQDPFKAADPFPKPSTNSFGKSGEDFFGKPGTDSFSVSGSDAFVKKDPFSKPGSDPFGKAGVDPFGNSGVDLFPSLGSDPFNNTGNKVCLDISIVFVNVAFGFFMLQIYFSDNICKLGNEAAQIAWARRESTRAETERRARLRQQEHADLALAIALSKADMGSS
uniref:Epidermal growth factor receptor pathway substrate 15 like 1 n=1 Tax=Eptatretus burgeri TaxID=7764 RepID=A0A8C4QS43_EPTBU